MERGEGSNNIYDMERGERSNTQLEQQQHQTEPTTIAKLPQEVMIDILSRLPIKSIAFSRCVSKPWLAIATNPHLTKTHLSRSTPGLILQNNTMGLAKDFYFVEGENHFDNGSTPNDHLVTAFNTKFNSFKFKVEFVGSSNGLLCLADPLAHDPVYICNPIIGEYMNLPMNTKFNHPYFWFVSGFGYDAITDQYKVIRMFDPNMYPPGNDHRLNLGMEIYTVGSMGWKHLGEAPYSLFSRNPGAFVNGNLHWKIYEKKDTKSFGLIGCFNLHEEKFVAELPPPSDFDISQKSWVPLHLRVLGGKLCIVDYTLPYKMEIWMMMDYGVKESWLKKYVIGITSRYDLWEGPCTEPVRICKNGNILVVQDGRFIFSYDPIQNSTNYLRIGALPCTTFRATPHLASLVSLKDASSNERIQEGSNSYGTWKHNRVFESATHKVLPNHIRMVKS